MRVNLLPHKTKSENRITFQVSAHLRGLIRGFAFFWIIAFLFLSFLGFRIGSMRRALARIATDWNNTEPLIKERDALAKRKQELDAFSAVLEKDLKKGVVWSKKLAAFSSLVPKEIWLTEISFWGQDQASLAVTASASYLNTDDELLAKINNFIERIQGDNDFFRDFQGLQLLEINKVGSREDHVMVFKFRIFLRPNI